MQEIEFNLLTEPWVRVRLPDNTVQEVSLTDALVHAQAEEIPAGRMGRPDEAGKLAVMLVDAPSYLTGQIITLDGAWI